MPNELKAKVKYPEFVEIGCEIMKRLCADNNAFPKVKRQTTHKAPNNPVPFHYIFRKPSQPSGKAPRRGEGASVKVEGGASVRPDTVLDKGDKYQVGMLAVCVATANVEGDVLTGKCFFRARFKEVTTELIQKHLDEVGDLRFVHVAPKTPNNRSILPVTAGPMPLSLPPMDAADDEFDVTDKHLDELLQIEEMRELDHAVYGDHELRIQALEKSVRSLEMGPDAPSSSETVSQTQLDTAVIKVLRDAQVEGDCRLDKLVIRNRLMAGSYEHRGANGEVVELRVADVNRALTKLKGEGKVVDDEKSGERPLWRSLQ